MMFRSTIHNWLALVAILAVTLLGAAALGRAGTERDNTMRQAVIALCERQNVGRAQIDTEFSRLDRTASALDGALEIAQRENGQARKDAIAYAEMRARLDTGAVPRHLPVVDCEKVVPKP